MALRRRVKTLRLGVKTLSRRVTRVRGPEGMLSS